MSIPKFELQIAFTAVRKKAKILRETNFDLTRIHFLVYDMHGLDEIRSNSNITDWIYIPTHPNVSDAFTLPIDFTSFKDESNYLNGQRFLQAKEINEHI